jgi:hypothetical protein
MLLALSRETRDFSIGSSLSLTDADLLASLAVEHGFEPAEPQWYGRSISDLEIDRFAEALHARDRLAIRPRSPLRVAAE